MRRKRFNENSTATFLTTLAVFDTIFILTNSLTIKWFEYVTCFNLQVTCRFACKALKYVIYVSKCVAAWLLVLVAVDRYTVVVRPFKAKVIFSRRNTHSMIMTLIISVMALYLYIPVFMTRWKTDQHCTWLEGLQPAVKTGLNIFDLVIYSFLPSASLLALNIALCLKLNERRKVLDASFTKALAQTDSLQLTLTLVTVSAIYLVCTLPFSVLLVYNTVPRVSALPGSVYNSLYSLSLVNSSVNFILYFLSGPAFRHELRLMFSQIFMWSQKKNIVGVESRSYPI